VDLEIDPATVHVVPHGAFDYLTRQESEVPLPAELEEVDATVVLCFGLIRPYKGIDVLVDAWRGIEGAELWIVGMPRMPLDGLRSSAPPSVRFVPRFVTDPEIPAYFRRADLVVLPYLDIDQSGVLFTALAFGSPLLLSAVGGFPEVAETGAAELVTPGDRGALHIALQRLVADAPRRAQLAEAARAAAAGPYAWDGVARRTIEVYESVLRSPMADNPRP
jgi:glycosyltransferase involved in cell wall biosynthesis